MMNYEHPNSPYGIPSLSPLCSPIFSGGKDIAENERYRTPVLATWFIRQIFWDFTQKFSQPISHFPSRVGRGLFFKITHKIIHGDHLKYFLGKRTIYKQSNTSRSHILTIDKNYSPLSAYFLTCKDVSQFRYIMRE